jgi:hypothetical protein
MSKCDWTCHYNVIAEDRRACHRHQRMSKLPIVLEKDICTPKICFYCWICEDRCSDTGRLQLKGCFLERSDHRSSKKTEIRICLQLSSVVSVLDRPRHPAQTSPIPCLILTQFRCNFIKRDPGLESSDRLKRSRLLGTKNVSDLSSEIQKKKKILWVIGSSIDIWEEFMRCLPLDYWPAWVFRRRLTLEICWGNGNR